MVRLLNEKSNSSDIIGPFFRLMLLWPHPNDTSHRVKQDGELKRYAEDLKYRWENKFGRKQQTRSQKMDAFNPSWNQNRPIGFRQKPRTFFFLANGEGLRHFAHINEMKATQSHLDSDRDQFWDKPDVKKRLTLLKGTLYNNTLVSYKTPTGEIFRITLSKPKPWRTFSQEPVKFYLGFSWNGPRAYNVKYVEPVEKEPIKQGVSQLAKESFTSIDSAKRERRIRELQKQKMELEELQEKKKKKTGREVWLIIIVIILNVT